MKEILNYIDIILLVVLLIVLFFIFRRLLGKKVGYEKQEVPNTNYSEMILTDTKKEINNKTENNYKYPIGSLMQKIEIIIENDNLFSVKSFINSSKKAFEMIAKSYANGNINEIKDFLSEKAYIAFNNSIQERNKEEKKLYLDIKQFLLSEIVDVTINENFDTFISVKYITLQARELLLNNQEPNKNIKPIEVTETWVFSKNIKENTSIWKLVKTYN